MQHPFQSPTILNSRRFFFVDRMKTFVQFTEDITQRRLELTTEVYDKDVMGSTQIRRTGEGGRIGADRRKTEPERRRMKAVGGGKMAPAAPYKDRKDIGTQRQKSTREQQPTQARGSAALSPKEAQRKAYLERKAREKGGTSSGSSKDKEKAATKLLSKKSTTAQKQPSTSSTPRRNWKTDSGGGMTRKERDSARNKEKGAALKARKAELIKNFTEKNGRPPKGVERTKLLGLAHKTVKAGV